MLNVLHKLLTAFIRDRRGNVAVMAAVAMPAILGSVGIGAEVASWHSSKRNLQNAADSAVIAAATNAGPNFADEAKAVTGQYGLKDGVENVTVSAQEGVACPGGGTTCYKVTVSKVQPLLLAQVVGFTGDQQINGRPAKKITAVAVAKRALAPKEYCVLALAGSGDAEALRSNGAPKANLTGCSVMSNSNARCNGHDLGADSGDAHGTNNGCGKQKNSNVATVADPYAGLKTNIPSDPCSSYSWIPAKKKDPPLPSANTLHGLENRNVIKVCGDLKLDGPVLLNGGANTTIIVYGGSLDLDSYDLVTQPGTTATIIFAGPHISGHNHIPTGGGTFDIQAPKTGAWKGVAIYQSPNLNSGGTDISYAGNSPTWKITGLVYLPHSSVTFSGAVNKSANGSSCFGLVVDNLTINGTGSILAHGQCAQAGLVLPSSTVPGRGELVS